MLQRRWCLHAYKVIKFNRENGHPLPFPLTKMSILCLCHNKILRDVEEKYELTTAFMLCVGARKGNGLTKKKAMGLTKNKDPLPNIYVIKVTLILIKVFISS